MTNELSKEPGDWGIKHGPFDIDITPRHKIRQWIGISGSMIKDGKEYWFYGLVKEKYNTFDKYHNRFLKLITPFLNKPFILGSKKYQKN